MLRVALVVPVPAPAGVDEAGLLRFHRVNLAQASALAALGAEVHVVVDAPGELERRVAPGVTLHGVEHPLGVGLEELAGPGVHLVSRAAALEVDVVHLFHLLSVKTLAPAALLARRTRVFAEYNGGVVPASRARRLVMRAAARRLRGVFFTAPEQAQPFVEAGVLRASQVHLAPEVSSVLPEPTEERRARARAELGVGEGDLVVLSVGRLDRDKDPFTTLEAFLAVRAVRPTARLVLAAPSGELFDAVNERVRKDAVLAASTHLRWALPLEEMAAIYAAADVLVHPSRREISGYAFIEALQYGVPIAGSDIPAFRAMGGDAVRLCPPGDARAFADAVLALAAEPDARARAGLRFDSALSFAAIAARKLDAYRGAAPAEPY